MVNSVDVHLDEMIMSFSKQICCFSLLMGRRKIEYFLVPLTINHLWSSKVCGGGSSGKKKNLYCLIMVSGG